ncbi:MAG TPA: ParB N-terminal domain-containing protein [Mucilaginibacter sp.]|jgi:hypothetical protein
MAEIIYRKTIDLDTLYNNPRFIKDGDFAILCKSIKDNPEHFEARPLILSDRTGLLVVIAGNMRLRAAIHLGIKSVPTILLSGLTEEKEKEIIIRDNINNGEWNFDDLEKDWSDLPLSEWGLDLPENTFGEKIEPEIKEVELTPFKKTHVLLSFSPEKLLELTELLEQIKNIPGVEYEQASN